MRVISNDLNTKLLKPIQTKATGADPRLSFWISRPTTQLTDANFLEFSDVASSVTDCSVAIKHTRFGRDADAAYVAYVQGGTAKVASSPIYAQISRFAWTDTGFSQTASAVVIAFDGTMPKDAKNKYEFITENVPWAFWASSGAVYGQKLGGVTVNLATENVTAIAAVRAMWSDVPGFDFGLVLFMIISGAVYYRQLIDGAWSDAEAIPTANLPTLAEGVTWTQISAQRTWDYRIALQVADGAGALYEVFTQFGGIGSKGAEHLEITDVSVSGEMTDVFYSDAKNGDEHIEISGVEAVAPYGGLYSTNVPAIVGAYNIADSEDNWGKIAVLVFDVHLNLTEVSAQSSQFSIVDENSVSYAATSATLGNDGTTVTLTFSDFNNASGVCSAKYTAGTITSMVGVSLATVTKSFMPTGLVSTYVPVPQVVEVTNI